MRMHDEKQEQIGVDENGFFEREELYCDFVFFNRDNLTEDIAVNQYLYSLYEKMNVKSNDMIGIFMAESFAKIHRDYQSIIILLVRGLQSQAKVVLRTMLEKLLILVSVGIDPENYNDWLRAQSYNRNRLIRAIKRGDIDSHDIDISKLVEEPDAKYIDSKEWSKRAGMEWDYNVIYKLLNSNIHHSEGGVISDIEFKNGEAVAINIYPDYSETDNLLVLNKRYVLIAATVFRKYYNINDEVSFSEYQEFLDNAQKELQY